MGRQPAFLRRVSTVSRRQHHAVVAAPWRQQQQQLVAPRRSCSMTPRHHHEMQQQRQQGVLGRWSSGYTFMHSLSAGSSAQLSFFSDDDDDDDDEDSEKNIVNALETASTLLPSTPSSLFQVTSDYEPAGDQPAAIRQLVHQMTSCATATTATADRFSILRGCTGTGKTLVMSHVLAAMNKPTLVLCHNKTLAVQLARELRSFLQNNAVELFVSYYNRYRPEFYQETTGTYMAKKSVVNAELDALRHCATRALLSRRDVVVVSSVSCLFGLGLPKEYLDASTELRVHETVVEWNCFLERLIGRMLYTCNQDDDVEFDRGQFQVMDLQQDDDDSNNQTSTSDPQSQRRRVKLVTLWPPHNNYPMQIELRQVSSDDTATCTDQEFFMVHAIREGSAKGFLSIPNTRLFPARHHVVAEDRLEEACLSIEEELHHRVKELEAEGKKTEALRLQARVVNDVYLLRETGFCKGIENYSRHFAGRQAGEPPDTLLDYFKLLGDWFLIVDESHVTLPQLRSMYAGDRARKQQLVKHGFRLPSALDNRPLRDDEFWERVGQTLFVSATPSKQELDLAERDPVDMVIRPTFVCDPVIEVRPKQGQLEDLLREVKARADKKERTLAIALTKRDSEDLSSFLLENGVKSAYLHSGLSTVERSDALRSLQSGDIDCLVGVNCLREGLDLPQVSLVAVLNTDSEGFLRSDTALLQIVGRAARNINGRAIFYANRTTESMRRCIDSTSEHRERQLEYNEKHGHQMRSTKGSSTMTFFDLLKDRIDAEQGFDTLIKKSFHDKQNFPLISTSAKVHVPNDASLTLAPTVETDHIPSSPGVYFWKDGDGSILYIGKAVKLRSRVRSYLAPNARHGARIQNMLQLAATVDIMLTPSERDGKPYTYEMSHRCNCGNCCF
jgi:excinuclease ABC subunit B